MVPQFRIWVFLFFFISGSTGLIYEVVWTRLLTLVMGNTHYSIATVLTAFMGGLALGSFFGGRLIDRKGNPLALYAILEAGIGLYCLLIPSLIEGSEPLFKWIYIHHNGSYAQASFYRFLLCGSFLLIPTTMMGATLPVLSKLVSRSGESIGRDVGTLYAVNTFGAVFGAMSSAFLFMRVWGIQGTILFTAALNLGIALMVVLVFKPGLKRPVSTETTAVEEKSGTSRIQIRERFVLLAFGFSGLCALVYQVAWNRILSLLLGSSVYAFSLILTTFILGLALGTVCFSRWLQRFTDLFKVFGVLQAGIGISALAVLPLFASIPFVNRWVYQNMSLEFASVQWAIFLMVFALLFLPTFCMGGQFPVVIRLVAKDLNTLGSHVGRVYAVNTVGTIIGSFLGGFVLIPWMGIQNTILTTIYLNVIIGVGLLFFSSSLSQSVKAYALPMILVVCGFWGQSVGAWDKAVISSGSFMPYRIADLGEAEKKKNKILFYEEGTHTTVTTEVAVSGNIFLRVNGKTDASLALDMRTQILSGYLPMMFAESPRSVLVIGQGSGITLGAVEQFPAETIDLVEISPAVIAGSRFFSPFNHNSLEDPRLSVILEDGRNHVALTDRKYDVIVSEPSNPWISGVGALFTKDFFERLRTRLNPGGIACIWVHTNMSPDSFKSIVRTFSEEFSSVTMWESIVGDDYLLVGSMAELTMSYESAEALISDPARGRDLRRIGINDVPDLMSLMLMNREALSRFSAGAPIHTDDNSLLEFNAPRYIYKDERDLLVRQLSPFVKIDPSILKFEKMETGEQETIRNHVASLMRSISQVVEIKKQAQIDRFLDEGQEAFDSGDLALAADRYLDLLKINPDHVMAHMNLGNTLLSLGRGNEAEKIYKRSIAINPYYLFGHVALAKLYLSSGKPEKAAEILTPVLDWYAGDSELRLHLGLAYAFQKNNDRALEEFREAVRLNPEYASAHYYLGVQLYNHDPSQAGKHLQKFLELSQSGDGNENMVTKAQSLLKNL